MDKAIDEVINCIINSPEYIECLDIKKKMDNNTEIIDMIKQVKLLQKKYLRTNSLEVKEKLDELESKLNEIPIYYIYNKKLEIVNEKINYVKDELNDYFDKLLNI